MQVSGPRADLDGPDVQVIATSIASSTRTDLIRETVDGARGEVSLDENVTARTTRRREVRLTASLSDSDRPNQVSSVISATLEYMGGK